MSVAMMILSKNPINKPRASVPGIMYDCIPQLSGFRADDIRLQFVIEFSLLKSWQS